MRGIGTNGGALVSLAHNEHLMELLATESVEITAEQAIVRCAAGTYTVTVPTAHLLIPGLDYLIETPYAMTGTVTVAFEDGGNAPADVGLDTQWDFICFRRVGDRIITVDSEVA